MAKELYQTWWVRAGKGQLTKKVTKQRQVGTKRVTKHKGIINRSAYEVDEPIFENYDELVPTGELSDTFINIEDFASRIKDACNALAKDGYEVVHISDVIDGRFNFKWDGLTNEEGGIVTANKSWGGAYGYGYGYSVTDGVVIVARLRDSNE